MFHVMELITCAKSHKTTQTLTFASVTWLFYRERMLPSSTLHCSHTGPSLHSQKCQITRSNQITISTNVVLMESIFLVLSKHLIC